MLVAGAVLHASLHYYVANALERENRALLARLANPEPVTDFEPFVSFPLDDRKILNAFQAERDARFRARHAGYVRPQSAYEFAQKPLFENVRLSPNGRYLAAVQRSNKGNLAVIFDLDGVIPPHHLNFGDLSVDWVAWVREDRVLIGYSLYLVIEFAQYKFVFGGSRVLAMNRDGSNQVRLFGGEPAVTGSNFNLATVTHLLPDDPSHILMPAFEDEKLGLWRVNIDDGGADLIQAGTNRTGAWFADRRGRPRVRIDSNKRGDYLRLYALNDRTGDWTEISSGPFRPHRTPNIWPAATSDDINAIYVLANTDDEDRVSIKLLDLKSGAFIETIYGHPTVDVSSAVVDTRDGSYLGALYLEDFYDVEFKDKQMQAHYEGLKRFFGGTANVVIQNASLERERFLVYVDGPQDPGDYYIYDYGRRHITPLFTLRPQIDRAILGPVEKITYQARDGLLLTAYLTHPNDNETGPAPLIVMPHGGPEQRDMIAFNLHAQYFASRGFRVLQPNFRGSSGYGKAFAEAGYGQWGRKMQDDVDDAVHHVIGIGLVEDERICIAGFSYGGYAALTGAMRSPELYRCAVSVAGVSDLIEFLRYVREEDGADSKSYDYWVKAIGHPHDDRETLKEISPRLNVDKIIAPVFLAHGDADQTVPVEQSRAMRDALERSGGNVTYMELEKAGHGGWSFKHEVNYLNAVEVFLTEHLKDLGPATTASLKTEELQHAERLSAPASHAAH